MGDHNVGLSHYASGLISVLRPYDLLLLTVPGMRTQFLLSRGDRGHDGTIRRYPSIRCWMRVEVVRIARWTCSRAFGGATKKASEECSEWLFEHWETGANDTGVGFDKGPRRSRDETP